VQLRGARNRRASPEIWQATFAWLGSQRLEPLSPKRHAPKPTKRLQARVQLWAPYLAFLEGTGHADRFRKTVMERAARKRNDLREFQGRRRVTAPRRAPERVAVPGQA
jgi:hypothetical protein